MKQGEATNFAFIEPMKALPVTDLPVGGWLYELKFDGYRALAFKSGSEVRLLSRNRTLFNDNYPQLVDSLKALKAKSFIIDGEIAALDEQGRSSFQLLQFYALRKGIPLVYYAFDLLSLDGADLRAQSLIERRKLLAALLKKAPPNIRLSEELRGSKEELLQLARQFRLEGLIAKRPDSLYEAGRRSGAWVKVKLYPAAGVCHRRLHAARRQPPILRRFGCRLPGPGRPPIRRPGGHRLLRESLGAAV